MGSAEVFDEDGKELLGYADLEEICGVDFCDRCGCCLAEPGCYVNDCVDGCRWVIYGADRWLEDRRALSPRSTEGDDNE